MATKNDNKLILDFLKAIDAKVDKLDERLDDVDKTLIRQHASLEEHIRRTDLLEKKLEPVEDHVKQVQGGVKLIGFLSLGLGVVVTIMKLLGKL